MKTSVWAGVRAYRWVKLVVYFFLRPLSTARFVKSLAAFKKKGGTVDALSVYLDDKGQDAGQLGGHYFHQDLLVAQEIFKRNPRAHLDIGGRIDGFVAHVACFREISVLDIRPLKSDHRNIHFIQRDFFKLENTKVDSLSCLHTIEHFGLGRYGDSIDPGAPFSAFSKMASLLEVSGVLYISTPISSHPRTEFNAHRVFSPDTLVGWGLAQGLHLMKFHWVDDNGGLHRDSTVREVADQSLWWGLGIYEFERAS